MGEQVKDSTPQAGGRNKRLVLVIGIIGVVGIVALAAAGFLIGTRLGWFGGGDGLLIGFPQSEDTFDFYLVEMGRSDDDGVQLGKDLTLSEYMIYVYDQQGITKIIRGSGFAGGSPYVFLAYTDDDESVFEQMRTNEDRMGDLFSSDKYPVVRVFPEQQRVFISEFSEDKASCYSAAFGEGAERLGRGINCLVVPDGKTVVVVEEADGEYTFTAVEVGSGDEDEFLVVEGFLETYSVSNDGASLAYVLDKEGEQELHLVDIGKGKDELIAEGAGIRSFSFSPEGRDYYYILEDDEGVLGLYVNEEKAPVTEGMVLAAEFGPQGKYLVYQVSEDFDEHVIASYSMAGEKSVEIIDGENLEFGLAADPDMVLITETGNDSEVTFFVSSITGKGLEEVLEISEAEYYFLWHIPGHEYVYLNMYTADGSSVYVFDNNGDGFYLVEEWARVTLLNVSPNEEFAVFSAAEEDDDEQVLYSIELGKGNDPVVVDEEGLWYQDAVFTSDSKELLYTAGTGEDLDEVEIALVSLAGGDRETLFKEAVLFDVEWGNLFPFQNVNFAYTVVGERYCPGAVTLSPDEEVKVKIGADEVVCFRFSAAAGEVWNLDIDSIGEDQDLVATLLDGEGNQVSFNDDGMYDFNPWLAYQFVKSGIYYVEVNDLSGVAGEFSIRLLESEDSLATAEEIALEEFVGGTITEESLLYLESPDAGEEPVGGIIGVAYKIDLEANTVIEFYINGDSNYEIGLLLLDADGNLVDEESSYQAAGEASLIVRPPEDGTYYLLAIVADEGGEPEILDIVYELFSALGSSTVGGPGALEPDQQAFGNLTTGEYDEWTFNGTEGYAVSILMESTDFDAFLELYDESGVQLAVDDDSAGDRNAMIEFTLLTSGTYTIYARSYDDAGAGEYSLILEQVLVEPEVPGGVNGGGGGGEIEFGETVSAILTDGAGDSWTFPGKSGMVIMVELRSENFDSVLQVFDPSGFEVGYDDDSAGGSDALIDYLVLETTGTFTILARGYGDSGSGGYTLSLILLEEPVTEENTLEIGDFVNAELEAGAEDKWYFEAEAGDMVLVSLLSDDFDPYVELFDEDGNLIAWNDDGGEEGNALIWGLTLQEDGIYQVVAQSFNEAESGEYTLYVDYDSFLVFGELDYGDSIVAELVPGDRYIFSFEGLAGDMVTISMESDDFDTFLELRDEDGVVLISDDDGGATGTDSQITEFILPESGTYLIVARGYRSEAEGNFVLALN